MVITHLDLKLIPNLHSMIITTPTITTIPPPAPISITTITMLITDFLHTDSPNPEFGRRRLSNGSLPDMIARNPGSLKVVNN